VLRFGRYDRYGCAYREQLRTTPRRRPTGRPWQQQQWEHRHSVSAGECRRPGRKKPDHRNIAVPRCAAEQCQLAHHAAIGISLQLPQVFQCVSFRDEEKTKPDVLKDGFRCALPLITHCRFRQRMLKKEAGKPDRNLSIATRSGLIRLTNETRQVV
jgi:hypothetical protein